MPERNNKSHITTGNDTTSAQLLGIRPTLMSYICVVTLKNKELHQQQKATWLMAHYIWASVCLVCWCIRLSHDFCFFLISNHTQGKLNCSTYEAFLSVSSQGNVYLIHTGLFCLSACPPTLLLPFFLSACMHLSLPLLYLCLTLPDGFSVSGLGDWFQLWMAGRRAACTLVCSRDCTLLWLCDELLAF